MRRLQTIKEMKVGKAAVPSEVSAEMIAASGEMVERVMVFWMEEECRMIGH